MKKVSVVDTANQTDPITIVDPAVQSKTSSNNKTEELQKQNSKVIPPRKVKQKHLSRRNKQRLV